MEEHDIVIGLIQQWFPDWSAAPVYYVEQAITHRTRVYDGDDRAAGLAVWLKMVARHKVKAVLIDTVDKAAGWKILRSDGDAKGLLEAKEIERLSKLGEKLGSRYCGPAALRSRKLTCSASSAYSASTSRRRRRPRSR